MIGKRYKVTASNKMYLTNDFSQAYMFATTEKFYHKRVELLDRKNNFATIFENRNQ